MKLAEEILNSSDLHDTKRLAELIAQVKSRLQVNLSSSGHTTFAMRARKGRFIVQNKNPQDEIESRIMVSALQ